MEDFLILDSIEKPVKPTKLFLFFALIILAVLSLFVGVKEIDFLRLTLDDVQVILVSRLPRLISIIVVGSSISITGLIILTAMLFFGGSSSFVKMLIAFLCCLFGSFLFIRLLAKIKVKNQVLIPLIGLMLGNVVSAIATYFAYRHDLVQNMTSWMQGSFSLILKGRYELLYVGIPFLVLGYLYADQFTIAGMGKDFSKNLGVKHDRIVNLGLAVVSMITYVVTVTVGALPFLDLIVPNIISMVKGDNLKNSLLDTALLGANFVLLCDIMGRLLIYPYEVPIGMMISVIGSAIFLWMILRRQRNGQ